MFELTHHEMKLSNILIITAMSVVLLISGGCHSSKYKIPYPKSNAEQEYFHVSENLSSSDRKKIIRESQKWLGIPYKYGGNSMDEGVDCSGMVTMVYLNALNRKLPRNSLAQSEFCEELKAKQVRPGDLAFFATGKDPDRISHVGIMLDDDNFIHSSTSKGVVISQLSAPYWTRTFKMFGRVPGIK